MKFGNSSLTIQTINAISHLYVLSDAMPFTVQKIGFVLMQKGEQMRLIDADALEREGWSLCRTFQKDKDTMVYEVKKPSDFLTIEPERKKGYWLFEEYPDGYYHSECSVCGSWFKEDAFLNPYNFCPNCGAEMRGEQDGK